MRKSFFLLVTLVIITLIACHKSDNCYREFNSDDLKQLVYNGGERLIFKNVSGAIDTFLVTGIATSATSVNSCTQGREKKSIGLNEINPAISPSDFGFTLYLFQPFLNEQTPKLILYFNGFWTDWQMPKLITINSKQVQNVYRVNSPGTTHAFKCIYWSFEYGILRFDKNNGEVWERINF